MKCTKAGCDQVNDFTEEILRNVIARGIADSEIQLDLLGEKNQDMPLKDMIEYIEAKESGKTLGFTPTRPPEHGHDQQFVSEGETAGCPHQRGSQAREAKGRARMVYASTAARWATARHPNGAPDALSAPGTVRSVESVAARITSTGPAWVAG